MSVGGSEIHERLAHFFIDFYKQNDVRNTGLYPTNNKLIDGNSISFVEIVIPIKIAGIHYKQAITVCNRWMVALVDCLIAMV